MKKLFILVIFAGVAMAGCDKAADIPSNEDSRSARVTISLRGLTFGSTKAVIDNADEVQVNTMDAFVFNASGDLDAYGHYSSAEDFTTAGGVTTLNAGKDLKCTTGAGKTVYVVINGNDGNLLTGEVPFSDIKDEAGLKARVFKLEDNKKDGGASQGLLENFQMIGKTSDQTFVAGENAVNVAVYRPLARIVIRKISKDFVSPALDGALKIRNVYMENVVGRYGFGDIIDGVYRFDASSIAAALPSAAWYNKYVPALTDPAGTARVGIQPAYNLWLNQEYATAVSLSEDRTILADGTKPAGNDADDAHAVRFYVMPNDVPWGEGGTFGPVGGTSWSPRHTKLVVEVSYGDDPQVYYYAIPIALNGVYPMGRGAYGSATADDGTGYAGLKANYSYEINELVLTRLGSTNPDEPTIESQADFNITVQPWSVVVLQTDGDKYVI